MGACGDGIQGLSSWFFFESVPKQRGIFNYYCLLRYYKYLILYKWKKEIKKEKCEEAHTGWVQVVWYYNTWGEETPQWVTVSGSHSQPLFTIICIFQNLLHFLILPKHTSHALAQAHHYSSPHSKLHF